MAGSEEQNNEPPPASVEELFNRLLPLALQIGITHQDFWNLTFGEIVERLDTHKKVQEVKVREELINTYNNACMIATFTLRGLNGKPFPQITELYPSLFASEEDKVEMEQRDYNAMMLQKERMIDYANQHNKIRQAKKEGESK